MSQLSRIGAAALAVMVAVSGCKGCKKVVEPSTPGGEASSAQSSSAAGPVSGPTSPVPLTGKALAPIIHEAGLPGELPERVVIELARDAVPEGRLGKQSEKTAVTLTPAAKVVVVWEGPSTLSVKPVEPLEYGTEYTVKVGAIETRDGEVKDAQPWTYQFKTPPFGLVRLGLGKLEASKAEVEVIFSGPVRADAVAPFLTWQLWGKKLAAPRLSGTEKPNVVRATLTGPKFQGASIQVALRAGAPSLRKGVVAPAGQAEVTIPGGEPLAIESVHLREGGTGYYLDVVCDDGTLKDKREYWDRQDDREYKVSPTCMLAADSAAHAVHFSPPVKVTVAPGPAGFRLFGDLQRGPVVLTIDAGARTVGGAVLQEQFTKSLTVPARRPALSFATGGRYLPRSAWRSLPVSHTNVDGAELEIRQIPPENLVFWLSADNDESATERTSDVLLKKTLAFSGPQDRSVTTWVDVASLLPAKTRGVLRLLLTGGGVNTSARLLLTDMNLVAKRSVDSKDRWKQEVRVWALDIHTTELLSGVEITVVRKSGKPVGRCTTSGEDGCTVQVKTRDDADDSEPFAILARKGDDLTYIRYQDLRSDTSDADVAGEPYASEAAYRAALWTERGVYRPGESAHLAAIVRGRDHRAPPAGMPIELQLVDPREKVARRFVVKTNEAGLVAVDVPFGAYADTGRYQAVALAGDRKIGTHSFNVEEFVPERMKVSAKIEKPAYLIGQDARVSIEARYLFGGSAEGSSVQLTCSLAPAKFRPAKENAQFTYGPNEEGPPVKPAEMGEAEGSLDEKGRVSLTCPAGEEILAGPARLTATAAVFEAGSGRSSLGEANAAVHPEKFYLGLQTGARRAEPGKPIEVTGVVVDWNGVLAPKAAKDVEIELVRMEPEYDWWWDEEEGGESVKQHLRPASEGTHLVKVEGGKFTVQVTPAGGGASYLVRAKAGKAVTDLAVEGDLQGWYWGGQQREQVEQTPHPLKAVSMAMALPARVKVGEKVAAKVTIPFRGRALLTVETDKLVVSQWKKVEPGELTWTFTLPAFAPNVYVSALVVKDPHLESAEAFTPDRAFGVASTAVEPAEFTAPLALEVPAEVRSSTPLTVKLDVGKPEGPTFAVVAAVDEGILQLTHMKSPDPLEIIFAKRALGVDTFETIGWTLLLKPQGATKGTGGDGGGGAAGRVQPVKPVALWSGVVPVGPDGKAEVKLQVPQYRGQLRVMAVTAGPGRMGRASASVTVKDPVVLTTTLPRFAVNGDLMQIPVFVTNLSGAPQTVRVSLSAEPLAVPGVVASPLPAAPLVFVGKNEGSAKLADGASATLVFQVKAAATVGAAKLRVLARAGPHESRDELDVPFLPAGPRERLVKKLEVAADTLDLKPALSGWVPTSERTTFWLTSNPYGDSFDHLKYLIHYPYGCVEQTTSSARPLLYVGNLLESVDPAYTAGGKLEEMIMAGVHRLLSMQTHEGGLAYWPGGQDPYAWGTAYAAHFLLDAQKAGYAVPQDRLDEILRWIEDEVARNERGERAGNAHYVEGPAAEAYLHYVLAVAGKGHKARIQQLITELPAKGGDGEQQERRYMLQAALYLAGDRRYEPELRNPDVSPVTDERHNNWWFYSDRRRRGFMLSTFQDLFGADPAGEPLAQRVAEALKHTSSWYSTQELVWGVTGLGKRVGAANHTFRPGRLLADGKPVEPRPPRPDSSDRTWSLARASEYKSLALEAKERGSGGKLWLIVSSEGVREKPEVKYGGEGLSLSRTWRTLEGGQVDLQKETPLAGLLYVELEIQNKANEDVQNVVVVDRIPAGFEIENPRLGRATTPDWVKPDELLAADYMDLRDHELAVFGKIPARTSRKVIYAVRAVTAGTFTLPPAEAGAMYDPAIWARDKGGTVKVTGPWKDNLL